MAMIMKSSDPLELAGLCDRVIVMSRGRIVQEIRGDELSERRIVEAIVGSRSREEDVFMSTRPYPLYGFHLRPMSTLIVALGIYATRSGRTRSSRTYNIGNLLLATMPLALVAMGQTVALLVRGFDVSVASLMTMCVVARLVHADADDVGLGLLPGALALVGVGLATGLFNAIAHPRPPPAVDHRHARHAQHPRRVPRCWLRDHPEGTINSDVIDGADDERRASCRSRSSASSSSPCSATRGSTARARAWRSGPSGSTRRRRAGSGWGPAASVILAFVVCSVMASIAGFYLAAQVQIGSPIIGNHGAREHRRGRARRREPRGRATARSSGRCSLPSSSALIDNVLPLFQQPTEYSEITIGVLILLALVLYKSSGAGLPLCGRAGAGSADSGRGEGEAPAG